MFTNTDNIKTGDHVNCVYGDRCKVVKVNAKSVLIMGSFGSTIKLEKKHIIKVYPS